MDFTIKTYKTLLHTLQNQGFAFQTFQEFLSNPMDKAIILRHDVDKLPGNSLQFAQIQNELGIKGSYFFRIVPESFNPEIIEKIAGLGHEIGYHYEDIDLASQSIKLQVSSIKTIEEKERIISEKAINLFEKHLAEIRKFYPVKTICMHGSPLSKYDNKLLWKYYDYKDLGIIGEPYFDVDFSKVLYLTDTGRRWNGDRVSIRDKVGMIDTPLGDRGAGRLYRNFKKTQGIIQAVKKGRLLSVYPEQSRREFEGPDQIMFTFHPQRWTDNTALWTKELVLQNAKNIFK